VELLHLSRRCFDEERQWWAAARSARDVDSGASDALKAALREALRREPGAAE
jgi:hypothetical protein